MNTNELLEKVLEEVAREKGLKKGSDGYEITIYAYYDDRLSNKHLNSLLETEDPEVALEEKMFEWYDEECFWVKDEVVRSILDKLEEEYDFVRTGDTEDEVENFVMCKLFPVYPLDHFLNQTVCVNIMMDTGDGNTDYTLNSYPEGDKIIDERASLVWLASTQGYTREELWNDLLKGDMSNPQTFLDSCRVEMANSISWMNLVVFLVRMTVEELFKLNRLIRAQDRDGVCFDNRMNPDCGIINLKKETICGLYDPWNGCGSVLEIQLEKDIALPIKLVRSALPDGGDGYSIKSVYGMCESQWKDTSSGIVCSQEILNAI